MEPSPNVDALKQCRKPLGVQLSKKINELETELGRSVLQVKLQMIEKNFEKLDTLNQHILTIVAQTCVDDDQEAELIAYEE